MLELEVVVATFVALVELVLLVAVVALPAKVVAVRVEVEGLYVAPLTTAPWLAVELSGTIAM